MKIISLNAWGGTLFNPLSQFILEQEKDTDIFCFQEVSRSSTPRDTDENIRDDLFGDISRLLPEHTGYFVVTQEGFNWEPVTIEVAVGNAIFIRTTMPVTEHGEVFIHKERNSLVFEEGLQENWFSMPRVLQFLQTTDQNGELLTIFNYHGIWHTTGKGDIPERLEQSNKILAFMKKFNGRKILCGDFNLDMETKSVALLEIELRNLVKEFGIETTRHKEHYPKFAAMPYADYTFVSPDIEIIKFEVPHLPVSDHLPMVTEFN